jgi:hypothetical protein
MKKIAYFCIFILIGVQALRSQFVENINPANIGDPRFIFSNPAYFDSSKTPFIVAGYQNLYSGLSSQLSNRLIGLVVPTRSFGNFAITAPGFQSPHFDQSSLEIRYSYWFKNLRTAIGVNAGTMLTAFDSKKYNLVDVYDPLLIGNQSLNIFNIGLGATSRPIEKLTIGISANHLNRPRISLQGDMRRQVHLQAGAMYEVWKLKPMIMWDLDQGESYYAFGSEIWFKDLPVVNAVMARAFLGSEHISFGAGLCYNNLRMDYLFDYPRTDLSIITGGTHQVVLSYNFSTTECDEPPFAHVEVEEDSFFFKLNVQRQKGVNVDDLNWLSPNVFLKDKMLYGILNPQSNPYFHYAFFESDSTKLINESKSSLDEFIPFYKNELGNPFGLVHLEGEISGAVPCTCGGACEKKPIMRKQRARAWRDLLSAKIDIWALVQIDESQNKVHDCIKYEHELRKERQHLKIQFNNQHDSLKAPKIKLLESHRQITQGLFNFSKCNIPCGGKVWTFGVLQQDQNNTLKLIYKKSGSGTPPEHLQIDLQEIIDASIDMNREFYCRIGIEDKFGNTHTSNDDTFYIKYCIQPDRLLVLYNFDRHAKFLGDPSATPTARLSNNIVENTSASENSPAFARINSILRKLNSQALKNEVSITDISGYTDSIGAPERNNNLSEQRAYFIWQLLNWNGKLDSAGIVIDGKGETDFITTQDHPAGRWMNRRVEITLNYD